MFVTGIAFTEKQLKVKSFLLCDVGEGDELQF